MTIVHPYICQYCYWIWLASGHLPLSLYANLNGLLFTLLSRHTCNMIVSLLFDLLILLFLWFLYNLAGIVTYAHVQRQRCVKVSACTVLQTITIINNKSPSHRCRNAKQGQTCCIQWVRRRCEEQHNSSLPGGSHGAPRGFIKCQVPLEQRFTLQQMYDPS